MVQWQREQVSETTVGREVFGPLGGLIELGAVAAAQGRPLAEVSVGGFTSEHRGELDRVLELVRDIGGFHPETMAVFEELGWHREHEVTDVSLLLWTGSIEEYPPTVEDPAVRGRMLRTGADLQLTHLMHALVGAATLRPHGLEAASARIVEAVAVAGALAGLDQGRVPGDIFRMWRVALLPGVLRRDSPSPAPAKAAFRAYAHALGAVLEG